MENKRLLIFTGDGKGKTTAALGMVTRAIGHGQSCRIIQFVKNEVNIGEMITFQKINGVDYSLAGRGFIPPPHSPAFAQHCQAAKEGMRMAMEALNKNHYQLMLLDEICVAVAHKLIDEDAVLRFIDEALPKLNLILTGRGATNKLIEKADTVTEMRCIKHAFEKGRRADKGVEY